MRHTTFRPPLLVAIAAAIFAISSAPARAQEDGKLEAAIKNVADDVEAYLKNNGGVQEFSMGSFQAAPGAVATTGVKNAFVKEMQGRDFKLSGRARFSCTGEIRFNEVAKKVDVFVNIHERGTFRKTCSAPIFRISDLATLLGGTGQLATDNAQREQTFQTSFTNPQPEVEASPPLEQAAAQPAGQAAAQPAAQPAAPAGQAAAPAKPPVEIPAKSLVKAAKKGLFGMEILRQEPDGSLSPVPVDEEGGLLFISLDIGDTYAIRVFNNTDRLAAATISIDGLNLFTFSEVPAYREVGKIIVPPGPKGAIIRGWHKSNTEQYSFQVADVGEAAVAELKDIDALEVDDTLGIITASFCFAINANDPSSRFPDDEPSTLALATAKGPVVQQTLGEMRAKYGVDREIISIRYDRLPPPPQ